MPSLLVLLNQKDKLFSGFSRLLRKGPIARDESPPGFSILITEAPSDASILEQYEAVSLAKSRTLKCENGVMTLSGNTINFEKLLKLKVTSTQFLLCWFIEI